MQFIEINKSFLGNNPFNTYSFITYNLSFTTSSSSYSNDIVLVEVYPFNPETISL
jgi:hypothetical protein